MTPQKLKNSILQLAIQGKLVEQRPEEGTAEELYREIQKEKQALIKEGKIKKEKPLPEIAEEELPFDIPENWKWVRYSDLFEIGSAIRIHQTDWKTEGIPFFRGRELVRLAKTGDPDAEIFISRELYEINKAKGGVPQKGDLLVTAVGTLGKVYIVKGTKPFYYKDAYILRYNNFFNLYPEYFRYVIESPFIQEYIAKGSMGTTVAQLTIEKAKKMLCPIPPLAEQKRIVAKIEELLPLIDRYEKAWTRLEDFNKRFPGDMQKSILQMAIQGKLVEQRPEEGTGEELYQQIQKEKQALIKAGKIKKEKPLPEISEDEIPFDIPESWEWVRIGRVFNLQAGKNITSSDIFEHDSTAHPYLCYGGNGIRGYVGNYNREGHFAIIGRQGALCGNINFADGLFYATEHAVVVEQFADTDVIWCGYFLKALNLNQYATATAQPGLAVANINTVLIPLPPLAEQKRIVARIEELLPLCEKLK